MLTRIFIQNFALIDTLEIDLHNGLQVITGETGAGKSIILGALRLILGERADIKSISDSEKKSVAFKRSIYVVKDIEEGEPFTKENIRVIRPEDGAHPKYYETLLGKKANRPLVLGTPLNLSTIL